MNREGYLDSMAYWCRSMYYAEAKEYPKWRTQCLNKPYYHNPNPKVLGKVTAVDYTSDKDYSSACIYVTCNPEGSEWIDFLKKQIDLGEQQQRISFNSHYGMYVEERPERSYTNYILYNKQEETTMVVTQADIDFGFKKNDLLREQQSLEFQLKMKYEEDLEKLRNDYSQKLRDLEKEKEEAERKEQNEAHVKAVKETYDAYIAQGFTKTQAETFIKICLENRST